ncbi:SIMPL domain-containing protein, partial [Peribacillus frigoritolerans]|uniref:SIMPL domain-containing protein n=1 Tax=Peribacillus frigoritolerans TaxID=450367 RepID=UPI003019A1CF
GTNSVLMALSLALTGSDVRKQWIKSPHCWLNLSAILRSGANSITSIRFSLSNPDAYYNQALSLALKNAYEKALSMARTLGISLNPVPNKVEELSETATPMLFQTSTLSKMATTPIQPGELNITASVRVEYTY